MGPPLGDARAAASASALAAAYRNMARPGGRRQRTGTDGIAGARRAAARSRCQPRCVRGCRRLGAGRGVGVATVPGEVRESKRAAARGASSVLNASATCPCRVERSGLVCASSDWNDVQRPSERVGILDWVLKSNMGMTHPSGSIALNKNAVQRGHRSPADSCFNNYSKNS